MIQQRQIHFKHASVTSNSRNTINVMKNIETKITKEKCST